MATLDPRDSHRRGRSKSPGRERSRSRSGYEVERESSRVRESIVEMPRSPAFDEDGDYLPERRDRKEYEYEEPRERGNDSGRGDRYRDVSPHPYANPIQNPPKSPAFFEKDEVGYTERDRARERRAAGDKYQDLAYGEDNAPTPGTPGKINVYGRSRSPSPPSATRTKYTERDSTYTYGDRHDPPSDNRESEWEIENVRRERSASFNVSAGLGKHHGSLSGGLSIKNDPSLQFSDLPSPGPPGARFGRPASPVGGGGYVSSGYSRASTGEHRYAELEKWKYGQPSEQLTYTRREDVYVAPERRASPPKHRESSPPRHHHSRHGSSTHGRTSSSHLGDILTVAPLGSRHRDKSPGILGDRLNTLSLNTSSPHGSSLSAANAPGSPLLEAYKGTYQSISPMPSPILTVHHSELTETFSPLSPSSEDRSFRRTARFHDSVDEAAILRDALKGDRPPDVNPLITILPGLTHDQVLDLRAEYKKIVKTGHERKGVNIAKHIKLRLKEEDPSLMKACYAVALGRWESEAYWANFWYQGEKSRRELLIESLMGRSNSEIREIKDGFSDKKYRDSLEKCMRTELKEDKFKKAVLLVLEERRMEESKRLDGELLREDIRQLEEAVSSERGGESKMIEIICTRSDTHLREALRGYDKSFGRNFAREMLRKSNNLVGELLAHILNGIINKPVRDALLVHHALSLSRSDSIRTELLISRLVRFHWDRNHMEKVKKEFRGRYGVEMQEAVREGTRGEVGVFLEGLCVRRVPDDVREL